MDYRTEQVVKIVWQYLMLTNSDASSIRTETEKFIKDILLSKPDDIAAGAVSILLDEIRDECQSTGNNVKGIDEISSLAGGVSSYQEKPLVSQLACIFFILSHDTNEYQQQVVGLLKEKWNIKEDILADIFDTCETLRETKKVYWFDSGIPKDSFFQEYIPQKGKQNSEQTGNLYGRIPE